MEKIKNLIFKNIEDGLNNKDEEFNFLLSLLIMDTENFKKLNIESTFGL